VGIFLSFTLRRRQTIKPLPCGRRAHDPRAYLISKLQNSYESHGRWKDAEQEYLQAGRIGAPCVKKEALAAIERLRIHRPPDEDNFEFELGQLYEGDHDWKDAEQHVRRG
jgi:hypothetical protein